MTLSFRRRRKDEPQDMRNADLALVIASLALNLAGMVMSAAMLVAGSGSDEKRKALDEMAGDYERMRKLAKACGVPTEEER